MRLAEWSTHPIHLPYPRHIHWASTGEDGADYLLLRLVTDDGLVGVVEGVAMPAWRSKACALSLKLGGTGVTEVQRMAAMAHEENCAAHIGFIGETSLGALVALQVASALPTREYSLGARRCSHVPRRRE